MAKSSISPDKLSAELQKQLGLYHQEVLEEVNAAGEKAIKKLVKLTKSTAPVRLGRFYKSITYTTTTNSGTGDKEFTWGAEAPHYRLTHLLVHGHQKEGGGRVDGDPFLEKALEDVLPEYEKDVEEVLKNAK